MRFTKAFGPALLLLLIAVAMTGCGGSSPTAATRTVTVTAPAAAPAAATSTESSNVYTGLASEAVIKLQKGLAAAGLYSGAVDGVYGQATKTAVSNAQTKLGVPADGIWGPATSKAYAAYVKTQSGNSKPKPDEFVLQSQADLTTLGYYSGKVDGYYGPNTAAAIKAFQKDMGLPVTGQIDAKTTQAITKSVVQE